MRRGIFYDASGRITGDFVATGGATVSPKQGISILEMPVIPSEVHRLYFVQNGELQPKTKLTINSTKHTILANETDRATISISPSVAIKVSINKTELNLPENDNIALTSDSVKLFIIRINSIEYYADEIQINAI